MRRWSDDGVTLKTEIAVSGSVTNPDTGVAYPFLPGGTSGAPVGWTPTSGTDEAVNVNYSLLTQSGETRVWSPSSAPILSNPSRQGAGGIQRSVPVVPNHRYMVSVIYSPLASFEINVGTVTLQMYTAGGATTGLPTIISTPDLTGPVSIIANSTATATSATMLVRARVTQGRAAGTTQPLFGAAMTALTIVDLDDPYAFAPPPPVWRDVSCDVLAVKTKHGRNVMTERPVIGVASVTVDNTAGRYGYGNTVGFRAGLLCRITASRKGVTYPLAYGIIDTVTGDVEYDGTAASVFNVNDIASIVSAVTTPQLGGPTLVESVQIGRLLDFVGIPNAARLIDTTTNQCQQIVASGAPARDTIGRLAETARGVFYADRSGRLVLQNAAWPFDESYGANITATFEAEPSDEYARDAAPGPVNPPAYWDEVFWDEFNWSDPVPSDIPDPPGLYPFASDAPTLCATSVRTTWTVANVINRATLANAGGGTYTYDDATSQKEYDVREYPKRDYMAYLAGDGGAPVLAGIAAWLFRARADAPWRIETLGFTPGTSDLSDDMWRFTLSVFLGWTVYVRYFNPRGLWWYQTMTTVQSVEHTITPTRWTVALAVDDGQIRGR